MTADLTRVLATADHCHGLVIRDGIEDACGKPPVAVVDGRGTEDGCYWPACTWHANRYDGERCVPLAELLNHSRGSKPQTPADGARIDSEPLSGPKRRVPRLAGAHEDGTQSGEVCGRCFIEKATNGECGCE